MAISTQDIELNDPLRNIGFDSIAAFGESASHLTDYANSENFDLASKLDDEDEEHEDDDDEDLDDEDLDDEDGDDEEDEEEYDDDEDEEEDEDEEDDEDEDED
jgi:hypothetical protein